MRSLIRGAVECGSRNSVVKLAAAVRRFHSAVSRAASSPPRLLFVVGEVAAGCCYERRAAPSPSGLEQKKSTPLRFGRITAGVGADS
ncbi:hypothetical protein AAHA92_07084 [Salvia divinorum]|uniref:Uncharacterized protein n=1 Tax=Salvia divinorum TaxID=28513 RepID=A0ABD1I7X1_SALDI